MITERRLKIARACVMDAGDDRQELHQVNDWEFDGYRRPGRVNQETSGSTTSNTTYGTYETNMARLSSTTCSRAE